jgi:hypothetical protein
MNVISATQVAGQKILDKKIWDRTISYFFAQYFCLEVRKSIWHLSAINVHLIK